MIQQTSQRRYKILVVGVGGQGALTAARFLGDAALAEGMEVMVKVGVPGGREREAVDRPCTIAYVLHGNLIKASVRVVPAIEGKLAIDQLFVLIQHVKD